MSDQIQRCCGKAHLFAGYCDRKPSVIRDGKHYCWQHDPERRRSIAKKKREELAIRLAKKEEEHERYMKRRELLSKSGVDSLADSELETIISLGGIREVLRRMKNESS